MSNGERGNKDEDLLPVAQLVQDTQRYYEQDVVVTIRNIQDVFASQIEINPELTHIQQLRGSKYKVYIWNRGQWFKFFADRQVHRLEAMNLVGILLYLHGV